MKKAVLKFNFTKNIFDYDFDLTTYKIQLQKLLHHAHL